MALLKKRGSANKSARDGNSAIFFEFLGVPCIKITEVSLPTLVLICAAFGDVDEGMAQNVEEVVMSEPVSFCGAAVVLCM